MRPNNALQVLPNGLVGQLSSTGKITNLAPLRRVIDYYLHQIFSIHASDNKMMFGGHIATDIHLF